MEAGELLRHVGEECMVGRLDIIALGWVGAEIEEVCPCALGPNFLVALSNRRVAQDFPVVVDLPSGVVGQRNNRGETDWSTTKAIK